MKILKEAAEKAGRKFIEMDLSVIQEEKIGTTIFEDEVPGWLKNAFENEKGGYVVYLREFHFASDRVKNDAMNLMIDKGVGDKKFPPDTFVVLGVMDVDDMPSALSNVHTAKFYRTR